MSTFCELEENMRKKTEGVLNEQTGEREKIMEKYR